jgi:hypothetical protein
MKERIGRDGQDEQDKAILDFGLNISSLFS